MPFEHEKFTMGFHEARSYGIDYRDFKKVDCLPKGVPLVAIAGVWGNYQNIRCLFADAEGNCYLRDISGGGGEYPIRELGLNAKEMTVGQTVRTA